MRAEGVDLNRLFGQVSSSSAAFNPAHTSHIVSEVMADIAMHDSTGSTIDTSAVLAEIGTPVPVNAMPDPHAVDTAMSS